MHDLIEASEPHSNSGCQNLLSSDGEVEAQRSKSLAGGHRSGAFCASLQFTAVSVTLT